MQKFARGRKSRGLFKDVLTLAQQTPNPGHYAPQPTALEAAASKHGNGKAAFAGTKDRFQGHGSHFLKAATPGVGAYESDAPVHDSKVGDSAAFAGVAQRFTGHGSHFDKDATPGVGEYDTVASAARDAHSSSASFRSHASRFAGPNAYFQPQATPGVGEYDATAESARTTSVVPETSGYKSKTDRFTAADGVYAQTSAPAVGSYGVPAPPAAKFAKGAVTMQKFARGRKSRGLFKDVLTLAQQTPNPGHYAAKPSAMSKAAEPGSTAASLSATPRFEGAASIYNTKVAKGAAAPTTAKVPAVAEAVRYSQGGTALDVYEGFAASADPSRLSAASGYSVGGTAMGVYSPPETIPAVETIPEEASSGEALFARLVSQWTVGAAPDRDVYFDDTTASWDIEGMESDLGLCEEQASNDEPVMY